MTWVLGLICQVHGPNTYLRTGVRKILPICDACRSDIFQSLLFDILNHLEGHREDAFSYPGKSGSQENEV